MDLLHKELLKISKRIGPTKVITEEQFIANYKGGKAARYKAALKTLKERDIERSDACVNAFVKVEKFDPSSKSTPPDPRLIQCRSPRFNIRCGTYLRHIEHKVYGLVEHGLKVMGKCMNPAQRGANVYAKWKRYTQPVALAIDASRFDQHVSLRMLREEHGFYLRCQDDPEFRRLLAMQERNFGYTTHGIRYTTVGRRMSGDLNTAVGNCILMYAMTKALMKHAGVKKFDLCVDGDDTLIILEQSEEFKLARLTDLFLMMGHEIKLERRSTTFEGIQWCQSRMCFIDGKPMSVRNYAKVISATTAGTQLWNNVKTQKPIARAVGLGLLAENQGVPIIQKYAERLIKCTNQKLKEWDNMTALDGVCYDVKTKYSYEQLEKLEIRKVSQSSRESYAAAWKITPEEQVEIEEMLDGWKIEFGEPLEREAELNSGWTFSCHPENALPG